MKVAFIVSADQMSFFLVDIIKLSLELGNRVCIFGNWEDPSKRARICELINHKHFTVQSYKIYRKNTVKDFVMLLGIRRFSAFDQCVSIGPKALLLNSLVAKLSICSNTAHVVTGQHWMTMKSARRRLYMLLDKILLNNIHRVISDSPQQIKILRRLGICDRVVSPPFGGIRGMSIETRDLVRSVEYVFEGDGMTVGFLGRINHDKGIEEIFSAIRDPSLIDVNFLIIGPNEGVKIPEDIRSRSNVLIKDFTFDTAGFYSSIDVLLLPSHREGFGAVVLEANSYGVPVVARNIYGLRDSVKHNVNGLLFGRRELHGMVRVINDLRDIQFRLKLGILAQERVDQLYSPETISLHYGALLGWRDDV